MSGSDSDTADVIPVHFQKRPRGDDGLPNLTEEAGGAAPSSIAPTGAGVPLTAAALETLPIHEDAVGRRAAPVSFSSVSSDPLQPLPRATTSSRASSVGGDSVFGDDEAGDDDAEEGGLAKRRPGWRKAVEETDFGDATLTFGGKLPAEVSEEGKPAEPPVFPELMDDPAKQTIPQENVSAASVGLISATIVKSATIIVDSIDQKQVVDSQTVMVLQDGTVLGAVATLMGPVRSCAYAVVSSPGWFASLLSDERLSEGVTVHFDTTRCSLLYDPDAVVALELAANGGNKVSDASYVDDGELPAHIKPDFSDDEKEREWKAAKKQRARERWALKNGEGGTDPKNGEDEDNDDDDDDNHSEFEFDDDGAIISVKRQRAQVGEKRANDGERREGERQAAPRRQNDRSSLGARPRQTGPAFSGNDSSRSSWNGGGQPPPPPLGPPPQRDAHSRYPPRHQQQLPPPPPPPQHPPPTSHWQVQQGAAPSYHNEALPPKRFRNEQPPPPPHYHQQQQPQQGQWGAPPPPPPPPGPPPHVAAGNAYGPPEPPPPASYVTSAPFISNQQQQQQYAQPPPPPGLPPMMAAANQPPPPPGPPPQASQWGNVAPPPPLQQQVADEPEFKPLRRRKYEAPDTSSTWSNLMARASGGAPPPPPPATNPNIEHL